MSDIQILGLRDYYDQESQQIRKKEAFFENKWRAPSVHELFENLDTIIETIPENERWNLYYTAANVLEKRGRQLIRQTVLPIDVDGIDTKLIDKYIEVICGAIHILPESTGIVASGNGLQFIIELDEPIDSEEYFDENRAYYKALCTKINEAIIDNCLIGEADPSVFSKGRLLRLPATENRKPNKGNKKSELLYKYIKSQGFNLREASGIPEVQFNEFMSEAMLKRLPPPDAKGVLEGCDFIRWCRDHQDMVSEPQWYALLSILGRLENGRDIAHQYSNQHPSYNERATDLKIAQAVEASGPRTCENISSLWDGCASCDNYQKCRSPITLQSTEYIKTKDTGFHSVVIGADGTVKRGKPCYEDLMKYFEQQNPFVVMEESSMTFVYKDNYWQDYSPKRLDSFAEHHFDPKPNNTICSEFRGKVQRNNLRANSWFDTQNIINFQNGILNLDTMSLTPHEQDIGFRYCLPFEYDPNALCPRFDQFLNEVTMGNGEVETVLLEFMGYALSGIDPAIGQKCLILEGDGSNGKSVFMDLLKYMAGEGNYTTLSMGSEINKLENRYQLDGKLFNISEETPTNAMMDNTIFKALVTGGEVQARRLYCDSYSMKNNAKIIMACNELPKVQDFSHGMFRRLLIVPFRAKFDKKIQGFDPLIRDKLYKEASGIYNRVIDGLLRFKQQKSFTEARMIEQQIESYRQNQDDFLFWWRDWIINDPEGESVLNDLYLSYKIQCEQDGLRAKPLNLFGRRVRSIVGDEPFSRIRRQGKRVYVLKGYRLAEEGDD